MVLSATVTNQKNASTLGQNKVLQCMSFNVGKSAHVCTREKEKQSLDKVWPAQVSSSGPDSTHYNLKGHGTVISGQQCIHLVEMR